MPKEMLTFYEQHWQKQIIYLTLQATYKLNHNMTLDHIALYVKDLEDTCRFFVQYFGATSHELYHNPRTGLKSRFLSFGNDTRLEIITRPEMVDPEKHPLRTGLIHLAFHADGKEQVDSLTARLSRDGYAVVSGPRLTGDGYYESCIEGPEGNLIEIATGALVIRPAQKEDAPIIAAALTMALGEELMKTYCGEHYQSVLEELAIREDTQYSYRNALVADLGGTPTGAIVGYDGAKLHELREPTLRLIEARTGQSFSNVQDETNPHEFYLDSLGVLPAYRHLGIGSRLLKALRDKAFAEGHKCAGLLVDVENPQAEHLYLSLGFERTELRNLFGHQMWHLQAYRPQ